MNLEQAIKSVIVSQNPGKLPDEVEWECQDALKHYHTITKALALLSHELPR